VIGGFDGRAHWCQRVRMNLVCDQHEETQSPLTHIARGLGETGEPIGCEPE